MSSTYMSNIGVDGRQGRLATRTDAWHLRQPLPTQACKNTIVELSILSSPHTQPPPTQTQWVTQPVFARVRAMRTFYPEEITRVAVRWRRQQGQHGLTLG